MSARAKVAAALRLKAEMEACARLILNPYTRAAGVGRLASALRNDGQKHPDVLAEVKRIHADNGKPVPTDADIDWWLEESELTEGQS